MLHFQDKDYREERKKVQSIIQQNQIDQQQVSMIQGRQKRNAANLNYNFNEDKMFYQFFNKSEKKDEKNYEPKQKKDRSVKLSKIYEFQFYDNYEELQELSNEIQSL